MAMSLLVPLEALGSKLIPSLARRGEQGGYPPPLAWVFIGFRRGTVMSELNKVPDEAIIAWESLLKPQLERQVEVLFSYAGTDVKEIHLDNRRAFLCFQLSYARSKLALVSIPALFTNKRNGVDLEKFWHDVQSLEGITPWGFVCAVVEAFTGPRYATELMTAGQRRRWKKKVNEKANALSLLLMVTRLDSLMDGRYYDLSRRLFQVLSDSGVKLSVDAESEIKSLFAGAPLLTELLGELDEEHSDTEATWVERYCGDNANDVQLGKPDDPDAHRAYFVKSMTNFLGEHTGRPRRAIVKMLVESLFGSIQERKIVELAPWPPSAYEG